MSLTPKSRIQAISAKISQQEIELAKAYIKGAVYCFCNNCPGQAITVRVLFGGDNRDWHGTPLQKLYDYHESMGCSDAFERAAIDAGWLLKAVLDEDTVRDYTQANGYTKEYVML